MKPLKLGAAVKSRRVYYTLRILLDWLDQLQVPEVCGTL
jgi:hypothetical protein